MAGKSVKVEDLVSIEDISERLLGKRSRAGTVRLWRSRNLGFPAPLKKDLAVWHWPDIVKWAKATGRMDAKGNPLTPTTDPTRKRKAVEK